MPAKYDADFSLKNVFEAIPCWDRKILHLPPDLLVHIHQHGPQLPTFTITKEANAVWLCELSMNIINISNLKGDFLNFNTNNSNYHIFDPSRISLHDQVF